MSTHDSLERKPSVVIVYHAPCLDGVASAWVAAKSKGLDEAKDSQKVVYVPYAHHEREQAEAAIRTHLSAKAEVYFVDMSPEKEFLNELMTTVKGQLRAQSVTVIDHHATAEAKLRGYVPPPSEGASPKLDIHIDCSQHSAAKATWQYLMPDIKVPAVIDLIDKMDGAAKGLKTPQDFAAAALMDAQRIDYQEIGDAFAALRGLSKSNFNGMAARGRREAMNNNKKIEELMRSARTVEIQMSPNSPHVAVPIVYGRVLDFGREVSSKLTRLGKESGVGVALAWFVHETGAVSMSIRTDGIPPADKIAAHLCKTLGVTGGGHDDAAAVHFSSVFEFARKLNIVNVALSPTNMALAFCPCGPHGSYRL